MTTNDHVIEAAKKLCKARNINPDEFIRVQTDSKSGNGYHTANLALAIRVIQALDIGFSPPRLL